MRLEPRANLRDERFPTSSARSGGETVVRYVGLVTKGEGVHMFDVKMSVSRPFRTSPLK